MRKPARSRASLLRARIAAALLGVMVVFTSVAPTAFAWPWDDAAAAATNWCNPQAAPGLRSWQGWDSSLGAAPLTVDAGVRSTYKPNTEAMAGDGGDGAKRLNAAYAGAPKFVKKPVYQRYGISSLKWPTYSPGCGIAQVTSPIHLLNFEVSKIPFVLTATLMKLSLGDSGIYQAMEAMSAPFAIILKAVLSPWLLTIALLGFIVFLAMTGLSVKRVVGAILWVGFIGAAFTWMMPAAASSTVFGPAGDGAAKLRAMGTNIVSGVAAQAATAATGDGSKFYEYGGSSESDHIAAMQDAVWRGTVYRAWSMGMVGEQQATKDALTEANTNEMSWSAAILNSLYAGTSAVAGFDETGKQIAQATDDWNSGSYAGKAKEDEGPAGTKLWQWLNAKESDTAWVGVPYLMNVKFLCADKSTGDGGETDEHEKIRFMYADRCASGEAGTAHMVNAFTGGNFSERAVAAFVGGFSAWVIFFTVGITAFYLMLQRLKWFFVLAFFPLFLGFGISPLYGTRRVVKKYGEAVAMTVVKQLVAMLVMIFAITVVINLMFPTEPALAAALQNVPWVLRPMAAFMGILALILVAWPLVRISFAIVRGDESVVEKIDKAPVKAAKTAGKVAVVTGAAVATAGLAVAGGSALAAGSAAKAAGAGMRGAGMAAAKAGGKSLANAATVVGSAGKYGNSAKLGADLMATGEKARRAGHILPAGMGRKMSKVGRSTALLGSELNSNREQAISEMADSMLADGKFSKRSDAMKEARRVNAAQEAWSEGAGRDAKLAKARAAVYENYRRETGQYHPDDPKRLANLNAPTDKASRVAAMAASYEGRGMSKDEAKKAAEARVAAVDSQAAELRLSPAQVAHMDSVAAQNPKMSTEQVLAASVELTRGMDASQQQRVASVQEMLVSRGVAANTAQAEAVKIVSDVDERVAAGELRHADIAKAEVDASLKGTANTREVRVRTVAAAVAASDAWEGTPEEAHRVAEARVAVVDKLIADGAISEDQKVYADRGVSTAAYNSDGRGEALTAVVDSTGAYGESREARVERVEAILVSRGDLPMGADAHAIAEARVDAVDQAIRAGEVKLDERALADYRLAPALDEESTKQWRAPHKETEAPAHHGTRHVKAEDFWLSTGQSVEYVESNPRDYFDDHEPYGPSGENVDMSHPAGEAARGLAVAVRNGDRGDMEYYAAAYQDAVHEHGHPDRVENVEYAPSTVGMVGAMQTPTRHWDAQDRETAARLADEAARYAPTDEARQVNVEYARALRDESRSHSDVAAWHSRVVENAARTPDVIMEREEVIVEAVPAGDPGGDVRQIERRVERQIEAPAPRVDRVIERTTVTESVRPSDKPVESTTYVDRRVETSRTDESAGSVSSGSRSEARVERTVSEDSQGVRDGSTPLDKNATQRAEGARRGPRRPGRMGGYRPYDPDAE